MHNQEPHGKIHISPRTRDKMLEHIPEDYQTARSGKERIQLRELSDSWKQILLEYIVILGGAMVFSVGLVMFLIPHKVAPGGVSGLIVVLNHLWGLPAGLGMLLFNLPIMLAGWKILGKGFTLKALFGTVMISVFTDIFNEVFHLTIQISDAILAPVFGGIVLGAGLGMIIKAGGATSGSGTIARIISKYTNLSNGMAILIINTGVIGLAGYVFANADLALYGMLALFVSSWVIDLLVEGMDYARGVYIISENVDEITQMVTQKLARGGTLIHGQGLYTRENRPVVFCVITRKELPLLVKYTKMIDPKAFVVISQVQEVLGEGFRPRM